MNNVVPIAKHRALVCAAVLMGFLVVRAITSWRTDGDTVVLVAHAEQIIQCLRSGIFHGCTIVHFPLFQFIPALVLQLWSASDATIFAFFARLNCASFVATVLLTWWGLQKQTSVAVALIAVFVLLTSPLLPYTVGTFNEPTAAFITLAFAVLVVAGAHHGWMGVLCFLAAITKETAAPFLFLIGILGLFRRHPPPSQVRYMGALLIAIAGGIAVNSGFNYFRYNSLLNVQNLAREFRVDSLEQGAMNFVGMWLSPNGGTIPFWPSFALLCVGLLLAAVAARPQWEMEIGPWPGRLLALLLLAMTAGLSSWYAPHGWIAWGPRLLLPWLPAIIYLTCYFYPVTIEQGTARLTANRWRLWITATVFAAFALPSVVQLLDPRVLSALFQPDDAFPRLIPIQENRVGYFAHVNYLMWSKRSMLIDAYHWVFHPLFRDKLLLYVACISVLAQAISATVRQSAR
jgi:hypothetical protein